MSSEIVSAVDSIETAAAAFERIRPLADALSESQFTPLNVDIPTATSIIIGVAPLILSHQDKIAQLAFFDMTNLTSLVDIAGAALFAHLTNLPIPEPNQVHIMAAEATKLRAELLSWTVPFVQTGKMSNVTIKHIREGSGHMEVAGDLIALVSLFRRNWPQLAGKCDVTEAQLARAEALAYTLFGSISRRDNQPVLSLSESSLRVRRYWTLADRAYSQCRRAMLYLEWDNPHISEMLPSLRRNVGGRGGAVAAPERAQPAAAPAQPISLAEALSQPVVDTIGEGGSPFTN